MSNLETLLQPHSVEAACAADRANGKSFILIDLGRNSKGAAVPSLERLRRKVEKVLVTDKSHMFATTKLYVVGDWNFEEVEGERTEVRCSHRINWSRSGYELTHYTERGGARTGKRAERRSWHDPQTHRFHGLLRGDDVSEVERSLFTTDMLIPYPQLDIGITVHGFRLQRTSYKTDKVGLGPEW
jgi:hypothetical protein